MAVMITAALAAVLLLPQAAAKVEPGLREDREGWIILHLQGKPYDVGYQHGALLAKEIEDAMRTVTLEHDGRSQDWQWLRAAAERICWPNTDPEYQNEIKGIADGMRSKGSHRDWKDVLALNAHIEMWDYFAPLERSRKAGVALTSQAPLACSAFVATGSVTKDGRPVIGHNFWWDYTTGTKWRVIVDIKPEHGRRLMYDALPGLIHSGTDWAINDAGIGITETTISGFTGFDEKGIPEFVRMRKAAQYSESLDDVYLNFVRGNNGGYANAWLMVDTHRNEIGKLELGLKNVIFHRTTDGYYVGSNFAEDPKLMLDEARGYRPTPNNNCELRKARWKQHLDQDKGQVTADLAKRYIADAYNENSKQPDGGGSALCGKSGFGGAVNGKVADAVEIDKFQFWARAGVPDGTDLDLTQVEKYMPKLKGLLYSAKGRPWVLVGGTGK